MTKMVETRKPIRPSNSLSGVHAGCVGNTAAAADADESVLVTPTLVTATERTELRLPIAIEATNYRRAQLSVKTVPLFNTTLERLPRAKQPELLSKLLCIDCAPTKTSKASGDRNERVDTMHISHKERKVKAACNGAVHTSMT